MRNVWFAYYKKRIYDKWNLWLLLLRLSDLILLLSDLKRENPERVNFFIFIRITPLI